MANYPTSKLDKALARRGASSSSRPAWQELMERHDTVPSSKAIQAPDVIQGFAGSWASTYEMGGSIRDGSVGESPAQIQRRTNRLGQPGMAEINFRPYDHGTARHGKYGPSLLGHPISFQVVGPTAKNRELIHQWYVVENGGGWDELHLDVNASVNSTTAVPDALVAGLDTLPEIYNLSTMPDEGLYLVVSMTGSAGVVIENDVGGVVGGIGDGMIGTDTGTGARTAVLPRTESSKFEVFRVTAITTTSLVLDSGKRLSTYFNYNILVTSPIVRAVTLIKPAATRLVAVPGSGETGKEQTFAFVPPKAALNADMQPPFNSWTTTGLVDPWTASKGFDTDHSWGVTGVVGDYPQDFALPIPTPINRGTGHLQGVNGGPIVVQLNLGQMHVVLDATSPFDVINDIGRIIHIHDIRRIQNGIWETSASAPGTTHIGKPEMDRLLGYFEIFGAGVNGGGSNYYNVRMVSQFDPDTGVPFYGSASILVTATGAVAGDQVNLQWTLHDPIEALWTDRYLHPTRLDSARLKNLIDPSWVKPTLKGRTTSEMVGHPALPDKAIFATGSSDAGADGSNENPGSLLDLGFRVVFFPAKESGGGAAELIPDFDNPIEANEVILDQTKLGENQFIEVDYSAGLVHLSHPPQPGSQLIPNVGILSNGDNLRKEAVFFASCVPFSREPGQMGVNPRVTAGRTLGAVGDFCLLDSPETADVYGARLFWPGADQTLASGPQKTIELDVALLPIDLPETGFVDVLLGDNNPAGLPMHANAAEDRLCTFGYTSVIYNDAGNGGNTTLEGTFGGAAPVASYSVVTGITPVTVVLRRNIVIPNTPDNRAGTDYQFDTTYGYAKRSSTIRFKHGTVQPEPDGSVTLSTKDPRTDSHQALFSELFSSWCIRGGVNQTALPSVGAVLHFSSVVVLIQGIRSVLPEQDISVGLVAGPPGSRYIYIDGSDPSCPTYATTTILPLPNQDDVLLASYTHDGAKVLTLIDLRNPLVDVDKRLDITVGAPNGHAQPGEAHFAELADAVAFVTETYKASVSAGTGKDGRFRRIKVIGPTLENATKLPITPKGHNGVIIEGAGWPLDGTVSQPTAITWKGATAKALFDLSNTTGWQFRNLVFRFDPEVTTSLTVEDRCLFITGSGLTQDILFENIVLHGGAHGFFYANNVGTTVDRVIFRNCQAHDLTDFAIRSTAACNDVAIYGCEFTVNTGANRELEASIPNGGNIDINDINGTLVVIRDTHLDGGAVGIKLTTTQNTVEGCQIQNTELPALWVLSDSWAINNNVMTNIHSKVGAGGPATPQKVAIWIPGVQDGIQINQNTITLSGGSKADLSIAAATPGLTKNCIIAGNNVDWDIKSGDYYSVLDNTVGGDLQVYAHNTVRGNVVTGLLRGLAGSNCRYSGNWFQQSDASNHIVGIFSSFHGDWFGDPTIGVPGGRVERADDCTFVGCRFMDGIADANTIRTLRNRFDACDMVIGSNVSITGDDNVFVGNSIKTALNGGAFNFDFHLKGDFNLFTGNHFTVNTLYLEGLTSGAFTVVGNTLHLNGTAEGGIYVVANDSVISDNVVAGWETVSASSGVYSIFVDGNGDVITGNSCTKGFRMDGDGNTATGNRVVASVAVNATTVLDSDFKSNTVGGNVLLGGVAVSINFNDNRVGGTIGYDLPASYLNESTFSGNKCTGAVTLVTDGASPSLDNVSVVGNTFKGGFSADSTERTTVTGNRVEGGNLTLTSGKTLVVNGNRIGSATGVALHLDLLGCDDYICMGNYTDGDIIVSAGATTTLCGVVIGNRSQRITDAVGLVGSAAPTNYQVTLGNKVDTGVGGTVYGVAPFSMTQNLSNVSDDA